MKFNLLNGNKYKEMNLIIRADKISRHTSYETWNKVTIAMNLATP